MSDLVCKPELAEALVEGGHVATKKAAVAVIDALFAHVALETANGKKVRVHGFGTFKVKHKPERIARNPANGAEITVPAKDVLVFKASK